MTDTCLRSDLACGSVPAQRSRDLLLTPGYPPRQDSPTPGTTQRCGLPDDLEFELGLCPPTAKGPRYQWFLSCELGERKRSGMLCHGQGPRQAQEPLCTPRTSDSMSGPARLRKLAKGLKSHVWPRSFLQISRIKDKNKTC